MQKRTLGSLTACFLIGACASGTPTPDPPQVRCRFDQPTLDRIQAASRNLPPAEAGDLLSLRLNREDSKRDHQDLVIDAQSLAREVDICRTLQAKAAAPQGSSKLDQRIENLNRRLAP